MFKKVRENEKPLTERIMEEITQSIVQGVYRPGDRLPNEAELAQMWGVGRSTVREAVQQLIGQNVLEIRRGTGTFVAQQPGVTDDPLGLRFLKDTQLLHMEVCELCMQWEPKIARMAAAKATEEEIAHMQTLCAQMQTLLEGGLPYAVTAQALYEQLIGYGHNRVLARLLPGLYRLWQPQGPTPVRDYQALVAAIAAHNEQAAYDAAWKLLLNRKHSPPRAQT